LQASTASSLVGSTIRQPDLGESGVQRLSLVPDRSFTGIGPKQSGVTPVNVHCGPADQSHPGDEIGTDQ
jgi:hypothetical protein